MKPTSWSLILTFTAAWGCFAAPQAVSDTHKTASKKPADSFVSGAPLTLDQVQRLLHEDAIPLRRRKEAIQGRGVDFFMTPDTSAKLKAAGANADMLQLIESKARPRPTAAPAPPPVQRAASGGLIVTCEPAECDISLNGKLRGSTAGGVIELSGITAGSWAVDVSKDGYISRQSTVAIEAGKTASLKMALEATHARQEALGSELLQKIIDALGGDQGLLALATVQGTGSTTIARDGNSVRWTLWMRNRPDRALFQAKAGSIFHEIMFVGNEFTASKNLKGQDAMEMPTEFGFIRDNQPAALLARLKNSQYKLSAKQVPPAAGEEYSLFAQGTTDKIAVGLDSELRPQRVRITTETGVGSASITYSDYAKIGASWYPKTIQIKPDGRERGIDVRFDAVELNADLKDSDYKLHGKPLPNLVN